MNDDRQLISSVLLGEAHSFEKLIRLYEKLVISIVSRFLHQRQDVEDVVQEIFIDIFKSINRFRFEAKLSTWIARIAYLHVLGYLRKRTRQVIYAEPESGFTETVDNNYHENQFYNEIQKQINLLPEEYRVVVVLYHFHDFSYKEIATVLKLPEGTVKSHLFRARKLLKDVLSDFLK